MPLITSRIPFSAQNPYRPVRPITSKIIFLSFEGSVTEEEYFERISYIFSEIRVDKTDSCPKYFATTVYTLLNKMMEMLPEKH